METIKYPKRWREFYEAMMADNGLHFLNTTIIPPGADGEWIVEAVDAAFVRHCLLHMGCNGMYDFAQSHIGHEATAALAAELFGQPLTMDRTPWNGQGAAVALQLKGRLPEGQILGREELEALGYTIRVLFRVQKVRREKFSKPVLHDLAEYCLECVFASGVGQTASPRTEPTARMKELYDRLVEE